jgi:putative ABC transport system ATP-binding protein
VTGAERVLELRGVAKSFADAAGSRPVLRDVDLAVAAGEIVAVAGRSGSGKTTLLTIVAGLEPADAGTVAVLGAGSPDGRPWTDLAILPQSLGLLDELTVAENIRLPGRLGEVPEPDDADDLMTRLGVDHLAERFPDEISLGEQQRVALARAAIVRPRLLLADEPISHQNQGWAEGMMTFLEVLAGAGTACLLATHNEIAFESASRVLELRDGQLDELVRARAETSADGDDGAAWRP